jgi:hypothetical protein
MHDGLAARSTFRAGAIAMRSLARCCSRRAQAEARFPGVPRRIPPGSAAIPPSSTLRPLARPLHSILTEDALAEQEER